MILGFFPTTCVEKKTCRIFQYLNSCQYLVLYSYTCQWRANLFSPWWNRSIRYINNRGYQWTSNIRRRKKEKKFPCHIFTFLVWYLQRISKTWPLVPVTGELKFVYFGTPFIVLIKYNESKNSCFSESQNVQIFR